MPLRLHSMLSVSSASVQNTFYFSTITHKPHKHTKKTHKKSKTTEKHQQKTETAATHFSLASL
jgi:hypothetical protein